MKKGSVRRDYSKEMDKLDTHGMLRNGILAVVGYNPVTWALILTEDVEFRVFALDAVLRHDGLKRC